MPSFVVVKASPIAYANLVEHQEFLAREVSQ